MNSGIENTDSNMGCYAQQPEDYDTFKPFFSKALATYHKVPTDAVHTNSWDLAGALPSSPRDAAAAAAAAAADVADDDDDADDADVDDAL